MYIDARTEELNTLGPMEELRQESENGAAFVMNISSTRVQEDMEDTDKNVGPGPELSSHARCAVTPHLHMNWNYNPRYNFHVSNHFNTYDLNRTEKLGAGVQKI